MSSGDDKSDSGSQNKLDIEAFRHHLLNYRSKADESESDITYQFDLDSSFKRMLDEKRQMTNKENNPPAAAEQAATSINPPEKPLRKDLLKERLRSRVQDDSLMEQSSYVMEHSIGTDMEFSTINRLLAEFNLNRESTTAQKRSPLKMLKITSDLVNDGASFLQQQRTEANNSPFARAQPNNDAKEATSSINADDTLEEIEYVLDRGLNYVPKRLINEIKSQAEEEQELKNDPNEEAQEDQENDENQENNEDCEKDTNVNQIDESDETTNNKPVFEDDEIIVLDSSPENSFVTLQTTDRFKSEFESTDYTFYTAKSNFNNASILSIDSDSSDDQSTTQANEQSIDQSNVKALETKFSEEKTIEKPSISQIPDISAVDSFELSSSTHRDVSSVSSLNSDEMPNFNDTLERMDYMMELGMKMMNEKKKQCGSSMSSVSNSSATIAPASTSASKLVASVQAKKTPVSQTKLKPKVLTPNSGPLKKNVAKHLTPNQCDLFKRPDQRTVHSPYALKTASASKALGPQSRIPTKVPSSLNKAQFRHIASPIAAYIKNTPEVPLLKTIKPVRNLMVEDFNRVYKPSSLDESTQSVESYPIKSALPRKMYISAPQRKIIDHRYIVTPGGKSVQKLIGNAPLVIRHDGKVKTHDGNSHVARHQFEESLSDLSMVSGDISVQVVQDAHRLN